MTLATKNGSIIVKDGKLAENCECCGGWYCYTQCAINLCCPGEGFWSNCQGQPPTVSVFGVTFTLTAFLQNNGWTGGSGFFEGSLTQTGQNGNIYVLPTCRLYRFDAETSRPPNTFDLLTGQCQFKYLLATGYGSTHIDVYEYLPTADATYFGTTRDLVRVARPELTAFIQNQRLYSPPFSTIGGNQWEIDSAPVFDASGNQIGTTTYSFSDGNQILP